MPNDGMGLVSQLRQQIGERRPNEMDAVVQPLVHNWLSSSSQSTNCGSRAIGDLAMIAGPTLDLAAEVMDLTSPPHPNA